MEKHNCFDNLGYKVFGRDDYTVQLKCLICGEIKSVDSSIYDKAMSEQMEEHHDAQLDDYESDFEIED